MANRNKEGIKPIIFHYTPDDNDVNLSLDEIIVKKGIKRVPKCYEDKKDLGGIADAIKERMVNDPERDEPKEENEDEVIPDSEVLDECTEFDEEGNALDLEGGIVSEQPKAKRMKLVYDDVEPIPDEEDVDVKEIHFGPPSPPKITPNLNAMKSISKRLVSNDDNSMEMEDQEPDDDDDVNPFML